MTNWNNWLNKKQKSNDCVPSNKPNEQKNVVLRADRRTEHGAVVKLMDVIREAGAEGLTVDAQSSAQGE